MTSFTKLNLSNNRVVIKGTDNEGNYGETVVSSAEWTEVQRRDQHSQAHVDFDAAVEEFFKPVTDAAEKLELQFNDRSRDPLGFVTLQEGVASTQGQDEVVIRLSKDSTILRCLDEGHEDRLVWVNSELEILEVLPGTNDVQAGGSTAGPHANEVSGHDPFEYVEG